MQVEHKTEKGTLCFQKVKDNHTHFELAKLADYDPDDYLYLIADESFTKLPPGKWQLIGLTSQVTEDQAKMIVDTNEIHKYKSYIKNFTNPYFFGYDLALDSFKSLLQHLQVYEVNPHIRPEYVFDYYGKSPDEFKRFEADMLEYTEAESRTGKWIVLFKPN